MPTMNTVWTQHIVGYYNLWQRVCMKFVSLIKYDKDKIRLGKYRPFMKVISA